MNQVIASVFFDVLSCTIEISFFVFLRISNSHFEF